MRLLILLISVIFGDTFKCKDNEIFAKKSKESFCNGEQDNQLKGTGLNPLKFRKFVSKRDSIVFLFLLQN